MWVVSGTPALSLAPRSAPLLAGALEGEVLLDERYLAE